MIATALHPDHLADLARSGLTEDDARAADIHSARPCDIVRLIGRDVPEGTSALVFPYPGCDGFVRIKLFPPLLDKEGRTIRYLQRSGTGCRLYVPPSIASLLGDPAHPLAISEGEKKALAVTKAGWPCVGIGGIWNFITDGKLISDLKAISWWGRIVRLIPDADVWQREDLLSAVYRLARLLEAEGATVLIVKLPALPSLNKTGADDFIVEKGPVSFHRLMQQAVTLGHPAFRALRQQEKQARKQAVPSTLPEELVGRRIHPALHFDLDGFAAVGVLDGATWRTITSDGREYPTEALLGALAPAPVLYQALGERWCAEARIAYLKGELAKPSFAEAVARTLTIYRDYIEFDEEQSYAVCSLWTIGTYVFPILPAFPRLNLHGEKGSGKSKTLKLIAALSHNGLWRTAPRAAPLFRLIEVLRPTLCLDELEHLDREDRGDIAAILNAGYQAGGAVDRCDPVTFNVRPFAVYSPIAIAGIKGLNTVLADRCITLILQPGRDLARVNRDIDLSAPDSRIPYVRALAYPLALSRWRDVRTAWERLEIPAWLSGRSRELWAPLLVLADLVASEVQNLQLRPAVLALARSDAEERSDLPEMSEAVLSALEAKLEGADSVTIQPGQLREDLKTALGYDATSTIIGLRLKALGFRRSRHRKGGSFYPVTREMVKNIRDRRRLADEPIPVGPQKSDT